MHEIVRETLHEIVDPLVYAEAADLIEEHRAAGREIVIVSSSGAEMVEPIGEMLGADRVVATRMVTEDGRYTGEIDFYAYGENKAAAMREVAAESGYDLADCYAYSDSVTDLPMLSAVGHPTAVNPDRGLRKARPQSGLAGAHVQPPGVHALAVLAVPTAPVVTGAARWASARRSSGWPGTPVTGRCATVLPASAGPGDRPAPPPRRLTRAPALPGPSRRGTAARRPAGPSCGRAHRGPRLAGGAAPPASPRCSSARPCAPRPAGGAAGRGRIGLVVSLSGPVAGAAGRPRRRRAHRRLAAGGGGRARSR